MQVAELGLELKAAGKRFSTHSVQCTRFGQQSASTEYCMESVQYRPYILNPPPAAVSSRPNTVCLSDDCHHSSAALAVGTGD